MLLLRGVGLSLLFFNFYSKRIFKNPKVTVNARILAKDVLLNDIRYVDNSIVIVESLKDLQQLINGVVEISRKYSLYHNTDKTEYMIINMKHNTKSSVDPKCRQI